MLFRLLLGGQLRMQAFNGDTVFLLNLVNQLHGFLEQEAGINREQRQTRGDLAHGEIDDHQTFRTKRGRDRRPRRKRVRGPLQDLAGRLVFKPRTEFLNLLTVEFHPSITLISTGSTLMRSLSIQRMAFLISSRVPSSSRDTIPTSSVTLA